ncbi:MAG: ATP-binding protein [Holophaga sp.]|nr:ATP-binding protein [Holophaga sp.]
MVDPEESERSFYLRLFEATPHPYLILGADPTFPILAVNDRYLEATGTLREAIVGRGLFEVFPDNPAEGQGGGVGDLRTSLGRVLSDRKPDTMGVQKYDIPLRDGSGGFEVRYWSPVNTPVFDRTGTVAWIIHHVEDVTEFILQKEKLSQDPGRIRDGWERMEAEVMHRAAQVKEANRALKTAMEELERRKEELAALNGRLHELDQLKSDFFANISHELRTPLTLILGPLQQRLGAEGLDPGLRADLERMQRNARILLARVNDLLDLARLDAGRMGLQVASLDLAHLVRLEMARFESLAEESGIAFTVDSPGSLPAQVDPEKVRRILANLLANAFKFTPAAGRIQVRLAADGGQATLEVADSGPGIPEDKREFVFDRFRQIQAGPGRAKGGTGLGLAIVKEFCALHGGKVALAESAAGGALFRVSLPLQAEGGPAAADGPGEVEVPELHHWAPNRDLGALPGPNAAAARVLVVEDNGDMRDFLAQVLARAYQVETAVDGADGLAKALANPPDLVVSDVMMPGMTGDRLVQELRDRPETQDIPVVLLTAKADEALRVRMLRLGVGDYLFKPFSFDELLARVGALLEDRKKGRIARVVQESRFQAMFDQAAVGMAQVALDGRVLRANRRMGDLLGYGPEELAQYRFQELTDPADLDGDLEQLNTLIRGRTASFTREKPYRRKDGSVTWVNRTISLARDPVSESDYLILVAEDINARKQAELDLLRLQGNLERRVLARTADLQAANHELDAFAYSVSHDLRAPLRAMAGYSQALLEDFGDQVAAGARDYLDRIILAGRKMSELIDGILALSRSTQGGVTRDCVDLSALARRALEDQARNEPHRRVEWSVEPGLQAFCDGPMVEAVMVNLVGNAWKYTGRTEHPAIQVCRGELEGLQGFCVKDNGAGFDMAYADHLFQPFQRLHRQDEFPGLGIGLATVHRIVRRHGGEIRAQSRPGGGAVFCFTLQPRTAPEARPSAPTP